MRIANALPKTPALILAIALVIAAVLTLVTVAAAAVTLAAKQPTTDEVRAIAEEAYIYAYPMMQNYKTLYFRSVVGKKRGFNRFHHRHTLLDPSFNAVVGPNNDTLYSSAWLDLRAEPIVISVPQIPQQRYYSIQLIDLFVHNFAYIGQRATGSGAGVYLIAGPQHKVDSIPGVSRVYQAETDFVFVIGRMLAKDRADQERAAALQRQYRMQTLSEFLGNEKIEAPPLSFPVFDQEKAKSVEFLKLFNFLLQFVAIHPSEAAMFERFKQIGAAPGQPSGFQQRDADIRQAITDGVESGHNRIVTKSEAISSKINGWSTTSGGFGPRSVMQGKFLLRAATAMVALYGNDREENTSFIRRGDSEGLPLDGAEARYTLRFEQEQLPPVNGFWSLTMYRLPEILLYENKIQRYSIGDRTPGLHYGEDGSLTLYLQHQAPEHPEQAANWLPAPAGPFVVALRNYLPRPSFFNGAWRPPQLIKSEAE